MQTEQCLPRALPCGVSCTPYHSRPSYPVNPKMLAPAFTQAGLPLPFTLELYDELSVEVLLFISDGARFHCYTKDPAAHGGRHRGGGSRRWPTVEPSSPRRPQGDGDSCLGSSRTAGEPVSCVLWPRRHTWKHQGVTCVAPWDPEPSDGFQREQTRGSREGGQYQITFCPKSEHESVLSMENRCFVKELEG